MDYMGGCTSITQLANLPLCMYAKDSMDFGMLKAKALECSRPSLGAVPGEAPHPNSAIKWVLVYTGVRKKR